ncbi:N-acetyl-gamma-glutamyl-phosphate reductase [Legionella massiliensis]|uniref:N-acetyl-gamma-glutamyl-phosphate reductase n=1 Tax=Legionella massiliensis TaxID=1034943 RepID=A0A078KZN5_9GAMM|nr:N-acetyl-gamma-glutamyl-phosphate reductase [Legionella massiliensis]CDZ78376.1 N-acetyl-gamma-glutamyl-phosphate reductase [Legionella massiliensis]CEE14114.1 N-acetyl-gamma-glutamyl-phosphate reductase [Legionella massiliensis]
MSQFYNVVISGSQGYIGKELLSLVNHHPHLNLLGVHNRQEQQLQQIPVFSLSDLIDNANQIDLLLLATPAAASMEIVSALAEADILIIDLSGAFRLPEEQFSTWYESNHSAAQYISEACYGLLPWVKTQANYRLIANPGCYATCVLMSILPLCKADLIKTDSIIIDAKSGVSGAGKQVNADLMFCEIANNFYPYKLGKHQHIPEILKAINDLSGKTAKLRLTTSIIPIIRGIAMSIYLETEQAWDSDDELAQAIGNAFQQAYVEYPLVKVKEVGKGDDQFILSLKNVVQTPFSHIAYFVKDGQITIYSCIDNLLKGAASQAIENINAIYQLPLHTGLIAVKETP